MPFVRRDTVRRNTFHSSVRIFVVWFVFAISGGLTCLSDLTVRGAATAQDGFASSGWNDPNQPKVTFQAEYKLFPGTTRGEVTVTANIESGFHIYSLTQKGGPGPSRLSLAPEEEEVELGEFTSEADAHVEPHDPIFQMAVESHAGQPRFHAPLQLGGSSPPEERTFDVVFEGLACHPTDGCFPISNQLIPVRFGGYQETQQEDGPFRTNSSHVAWTGFIEPLTAQPGQTIRLALTATPDAGYHLYGWQDGLTEPAIDSAVTPTLIVLTKRNNWNAQPPTPSMQPTPHKTGEMTADWHTSAVTWSIEIEVPRDVEAGQYELAGLLGFQTCTPDACDMPAAAEFTTSIQIGETTELGQLPVRFQATDRSYAEVRKAAQSSPYGHVNQNALGDRPILAILGLAFLAGLVLNVMPCVLPVIGLKIMSFVDQAGARRWEIIKLNLWFAGGLISVFLILATLAAVFGLGWGQHFQSVTFTLALILIVFTFALSFLGVWEIPIPGFVSSVSSKGMARREGAIGAFSKGIFTTVLATPCTGPFLVPAISWSLTQPAWLTYLLFATVGLGMASPYLLIGAFPGLINLLPRPGAWMVRFKQLMGFVLMGTVVFLFGSLEQKLFLPTLYLLVGISIACWWIGQTPATAPIKRQLTAWTLSCVWSIGVAFFVFGYLFGGVELDWQDYERQLLDRQVSEGKTVLVDFTADWCSTCKANERFALNTKATKRYLEQNDVIAMKADMTRTAPAIESLLDEMGHSTRAIPFIAIFPADGGPPITHAGLLTQEKVLELLDADRAE